MTKQLFTIAAAILLCLPLTGSTQPGPDDDPSVMMPMRRERIEKRIQTMRMWKLTEELDLTEDQASRFMPLMHSMDRKLDDLRHTRQETIRKLGDLAWDEKVHAEEINKLITDLESLEEQQLAVRKQFRQDVSGVLKPAQMGRLVLFNLRFPEIVRESIREFEERGDLPPVPPRRPGGRGDW